MDDDELGTVLIGGAIQVHKTLGPGLLESIYEACLFHELAKTGLQVEKQVIVPVTYDGIRFDEGFRMDILFGNRIVVEAKAVERLLPIHTAQLLTYLKITNLRIGYLLNFNSVRMREGGIKRIVND